MPRTLPVVAPLSAFVALAALGGALQPDYSHRRDYLSALASVGARAPAVGVSALLALALAHAGGAAAVRRTAGARLAPALLLGAAASGVVIASARISCPGGAAGCSTGTGSPGDSLAGVVHGRAVGAYAVLVVLAMITTVRPAWRAGHSVLAAASPPCAAASAGLLLAQLASPTPGGWQRGWVAVSVGWLLLAGAAPLPRSGRGRPTPGR